MDRDDGSPAGSTDAATPAAGGTHRAAAPGIAGPLPVVTLWEHFGAGADAIGREVAQRLALPYHQQAFSSEEIESDGRDRGPSAEQQAAQIESSLALAQVFSAMGGMYGGFDGRDIIDTQEQKRTLIAENDATVHRYAEEGGVIVGRNATVLLADRPRTLHVLLTADPETRIVRAAERAGISHDRAARRQKREDQVRVDMSKSLYGWDPSAVENYDMVLNTSRLSQDAAVEAIVHAVTGPGAAR